jgi:hypothetical protein
VDLHEEGNNGRPFRDRLKEAVLGMLLKDVKDAGKLVADMEKSTVKCRFTISVYLTRI